MRCPRRHLFVYLKNTRDVRMVQRGRRLRLPIKPRAIVFGSQRRGRQDLYCDRTVELRVLGLVDDSHAAAAKLGGDFIVRK